MQQSVKITRAITFTERAERHLQGEENAIEDIVAWKNSADDTKKKGFYVDWVGEKWHSPLSVEKETYNNVREKAEYLINFLAPLAERPSVEELRKEILKKSESLKS
jgi:hypothetical protein